MVGGSGDDYSDDDDSIDADVDADRGGWWWDQFGESEWDVV